MEVNGALFHDFSTDLVRRTAASAVDKFSGKITFPTGSIVQTAVVHTDPESSLISKLKWNLTKMSNTEVEPDLTNVDYEDVLHLYRGWRKSEGALKDKTKELNALKIRVKQLQESHIKFRGQIQALESKWFPQWFPNDLSILEIDRYNAPAHGMGLVGRTVSMHQSTITHNILFYTSILLCNTHCSSFILLH